MAKVRIQKVLAEAGVASRRTAEEMVLTGRVAVNGKVVTALPCFVDLPADRIHVDGSPLRIRRHEKVYLLLNKPRGVVCTQGEAEGRAKAVDLVPKIPGGRVYCVGGLDMDGTGLLLLTNDGELTHYLTHPRYGVPKTYVVEIEGVLSAEDISAVKRGVYLDGRRTAGAALKVLRKSPGRSLIELTVTEGRNREIRRTLLQFGMKVCRLKRVAIGPITDRGVKIGNFRPLKPFEVAKLRRCGDLPMGRSKVEGGRSKGEGKREEGVGRRGKGRGSRQ